MLRSLIIVAVIILVFLLVKTRLRKREPSGQKNKEPSDTVKCAECNIYIPTPEAIISDNRYFCCKQHQRDWLASQPGNH